MKNYIHCRCEVETANGYTNQAVDEIMCTRSLKPHDKQACYAPCVGECVVSEWSNWSRCKQVRHYMAHI